LQLREPDVSRIVGDLTASGIIKRFTIDVDYRKLGYPEMGIFIFGLKDKKSMGDVVRKLQRYIEIVEIQEVFGDAHDVIIRVMAENNERIRQICKEVEEWEEVNSDARSFTLIFALTHRREPGIQL